MTGSGLHNLQSRGKSALNPTLTLLIVALEMIMLKKLIFLIIFLSFSVYCFGQETTEYESCNDCHSGKKEDVSRVTMEVIDKSVHEGTECLECHLDAEELPHAEKLDPVNCGECHEDETAAYKRHGMLEVGSAKDIPACSDCHGTHSIIASSEEKSSVHPLNLPTTCGKCHEDPNLTDEHTFLPKTPVQAYQASVHGKANAEGEYKAASCSDCHSSNGSTHQILAPGNPVSTINHFAIPKTCGKCHEEIEKEYWEGIHGQLTLRGKTDSPVCTNCHGEHRILSHEDKDSPVNRSRLAEATCTPCHESANLTEKYGLPAGQLASFIDSYHGQKSKAGDNTVANCASCHGAHRILPHEDPGSSIHLNNLPDTCGECHPGITEEIATTPIHDGSGPQNKGWPYFFTILYIVLISGTVTGMLLYIILDLFRQTRKITSAEQIRRMSRFAVIQHSLLALSFISLVITGFALRFGDSWWALFLFGREGGFPLRNLVHRISAVVLILTAFMHLAYLASSNGTRFLKDMFPGLKDLKELILMLKFNLGFTEERPRFGRFSYVEKFEYWALLWGTLLMAITGTILWFDNFFVQYLPKVVLDVVLVIHYYEAWLATLAILIWHFYATIFNPGVYPMNPAWITGSMPKDQYMHEHPEYLPEHPDE